MSGPAAKRPTGFEPPMSEAFFTAEKSRMAYRIICARDRVIEAQRILDQICAEDLALRSAWQEQHPADAVARSKEQQT
jgi:hypothetical protein